MRTTKQRHSQDAIASLKADHKKVKGLFEKFEKAKDRRTKKTIAMEALEELGIHATLEEELFYPAVRAAIKDKEGIMEEADEEHHVAKVLIAELEGMNGGEGHYDAKFTVLAENVRHHIKEEEGEMLPKAQKTRIDLTALGEQMLERKEALQREGVPVTAEAEMVAKSQGQGIVLQGRQGQRTDRLMRGGPKGSCNSAKATAGGAGIIGNCGISR